MLINVELWKQCAVRCCGLQDVELHVELQVLHCVTLQFSTLQLSGVFACVSVRVCAQDHALVFV